MPADTADALSLSILLASRRDLTLIVGRRDAEGDPVLPSRLLLAADQQTVARRALKFFGESGDRRPALAGGLGGHGDRPHFPIPRPESLAEPIEGLSATAFRDYLACPYRFYLKHVLHLKVVSDDAREMDGAAFGNLMHEVLRRFGDDAACQSIDVAEIGQRLEQLLDQCVLETFGRHPMVAVRVQVQQLRMRLRAFAEKQAGAQQGWEIVHTEVPRDRGDVPWQVDESPIRLSGRIDRIDRHAETGQFAVLDYKSSDAGDGPGKLTVANAAANGSTCSCHCIDIWPQYRVQRAGAIGFLLLPKDTSKTGFAGRLERSGLAGGGPGRARNCAEHPPAEFLAAAGPAGSLCGPLRGRLPGRRVWTAGREG